VPARRRGAGPEVVHRATETAQKCVDDAGAPCETAKEYKKAFLDGELGETHASTSDCTKAFKRTMRRAVVRQGLIPPLSARPAARASYQFEDWSELWNGFVNALDCVAPGAESSCREDIDDVKALKKPTKMVIGCAGVAVLSYYTVGTAPTVAAALSGATLCAWDLAIDAW
jgi:hypothetical protein